MGNVSLQEANLAALTGIRYLLTATVRCIECRLQVQLKQCRNTRRIKSQEVRAREQGRVDSWTVNSSSAFFSMMLSIKKRYSVRTSRERI